MADASNILRRNHWTHLNDFGGMDKVDSIQAVFFHASPDGEDVGVKYDVTWIKAQFSHE